MIKHDYFEINKIIKGPFEYVLSTGPIYWFNFTLSKDQLKENVENEEGSIFYINNINLIENFVKEYLSEIEEEPHTIRYTSIPYPSRCNFDLVVIAKISNNGTCFIFSDDIEYLNLIKQR